MPRGIGTIAALVAFATVALSLPASAAPAQQGGPEQTREGFVRDAERICRRDTARSKRILRGARRRTNHGMRPAAGRQFARAAATFGAAVNQLMRIPLPPPDQGRLKAWFKSLRTVHRRMRILANKLRADQQFASNYAAIHLERSANTANNVGYPFGFKYCRFTRSRFG